MINYELTCTEAFTPIAKGMKEWEKKLATERIIEMATFYHSRMKEAFEEQDGADYLNIAECLYEMPNFSKKELRLFSNCLKIRKIKIFFFEQVQKEKAVRYTDFVNEVHQRLGICGNGNTTPIGVVQTALNELEKDGYVVKIKKQRKTYIYRTR